LAIGYFLPQAISHRPQGRANQWLLAFLAGARFENVGVTASRACLARTEGAPPEKSP